MEQFASGTYLTPDGFREMLEKIRSESIKQSDLLHDIATDLGGELAKVEIYDHRSGLMMVTRQTQKTASSVRSYLDRAAQAIEGAGTQSRKAWEVFYKGILGPAMSSTRQFELRPKNPTRKPGGFTGVPNPYTQKRPA